MAGADVYEVATCMKKVGNLSQIMFYQWRSSVHDTWKQRQLCFPHHLKNAMVMAKQRYMY